MGCDIHVYIEYKLGDGPWTLDKGHKVVDEGSYKYLEDAWATGRDYALFARLAGVRGSGPKPRGVPKDASELIKEYARDDEQYGDNHSHSFHSLATFKSRLYRDGDYILKDAAPIAFDNEGKDYSLSYPNLIAYVEKKVKEFEADLAAEQMLLGQAINTKVKCRFVYWFDN